MRVYLTANSAASAHTAAPPAVLCSIKEVSSDNGKVTRILGAHSLFVLHTLCPVLALSMVDLQDVHKMHAQSLPGAAYTLASPTVAAETGTTHARIFWTQAANTIRRKWMAYQPSFAAQCLLWISILVLSTTLLVALATSAAAQLFYKAATSATSAQRSAAYLHNTASVSAAACRRVLPVGHSA